MRSQDALWALLGMLALSACTGSNGQSGKDGKNGANGITGANGVNRRPSLIAVADEPSGDHCSLGGKRIDTGIDLNGNGSLDPNEVTASTYVCSGAPGASGADGSSGSMGADGGIGAPGRSSLVRTSRETPGANCAHGGIRIETGIDANGDGTLQDGEVISAQTQFLCSPPGVGACSAPASIAIAGDYVAADGTEHWLRKTGTATTYSVVPAGAPAPTAPPRMFRVTEVCEQWLLLEAPSGSFGRLDWATTGNGLNICVRDAANAAAAAALAPADATSTATGCAGGQWTTLTREAP